MQRLGRSIMAAGAILMALAPGTAGAANDRVVHGSFPIDESFVVEPDSTICGFEITLDLTGRGTFTARLDDQGLNEWVHVHARTVGILSANGIELRDFSSLNRFFDFRTLTNAEVGLVFRDSFLDGGVVIMDRGRLIWNFDPNTGETVGDPIFEAGPHPELHGDIEALCAALTP
jgi:hypothetical protein